MEATFIKLTMLALADSVNPCAIAVLAMILVSILINNPGKKRQVLFAGLAFVASVFFGYLVYGLIIVQFFKSFAEFLRINSRLVFNSLAILAMVLGALNIKDYFMYRKGGLATEMPLSWRPKVNKIISEINSPRGAFLVGFIVTLFLLPCTMGPYIIASGLIADLPLITAVSWLVYYNLVFVSPMILITLLVYFGFREVDEISGWQKKNIRRLHLIAGVLLFATGFALLMGWL